MKYLISFPYNNKKHNRRGRSNNLYEQGGGYKEKTSACF
jgi:hypothetical protein